MTEEKNIFEIKTSLKINHSTLSSPLSSASSSFVSSSLSAASSSFVSFVTSSLSSATSSFVFFYFCDLDFFFYFTFTSGMTSLSSFGCSEIYLIAATSVNIIFFLTSIISSTVKKIVHPNILATEITYLALFSLSSFDFPNTQI